MTMETDLGIAIIGMAGRFPGAGNVEEFWQLLLNGKCAARQLSRDELLASGAPEDLFSRQNFVSIGYPLDDFDAFDHEFFDFSASAADVLDPQQRLFLETAYHAFEDAGYSPASHGRNTGVFAGANISSYLLFNLLKDVDLRRPSNALEMLLANDKDYLATRVSYKLNLRGPSMTVQTACSSSLVAVCQAAQSLLCYECDLAVAGGVAVRMPYFAGYLYEPGGVLSPDGLCRSFDAQANGTVFGNAVGVVLLKRLADAVRDNDPIHAVIRGFATNNDGSAKAGFTAPSLDAQAAVVQAALASGSISPDSIGMIEAHATATPIGDPIEFAALARAFGESTSREDRCFLGAAKSNVGHCDSAAGVVSLIKAALSVANGIIPASIHYSAPNPRIRFDGTPFEVARVRTPWPEISGPRRAGVSSFGMGGTNAHVVVEQPPKRALRQSREPGWALLTLSARSDAALKDLRNRYANHLSTGGEWFADLVATTNVERPVFSHRVAVLASSAHAASRALAGGSERDARVVASSPTAEECRVCWVFGGPDAGTSSSGRELYTHETQFRLKVDECSDALPNEAIAQSVRRSFQEETGGTVSDEFIGVRHLTLQIGLAAWWSAAGVKPQVVTGFGMGEYAAAHVAGIIDFPTAVALTLARTKLLAEHNKNHRRLVAIGSRKAIEGIITDSFPRLNILSVLGSAVTIVGDDSELLRCAAMLRVAGLEAGWLAAPGQVLSGEYVVDQPKWDNDVGPLVPSAVGTVTFKGSCALSPQDPMYWLAQLSAPIDIAQRLSALVEQGRNTFLEVGAGGAISEIGSTLIQSKGIQCLSSMRAGQPECRQLLESYAHLFSAGGANHPGLLCASGEFARTRLPLYPFEKHRHWHTSSQIRSGHTAMTPMDNTWIAAVNAGILRATDVPEELIPSKVAIRQQLASRYTVASILRVFSSLACFQQGAASIEEIMQRGAIKKQFRPLIESWMHYLQEYDLASADEDHRFTLIGEHSESDYSNLRKVLSVEFGEGAAYTKYLVSCADSLPMILTGKLSPLETLFPKGDYEIVDGLYRTGATAQYFNGIAGSVVTELADKCGYDGTTRVLEIGAGTGGLTSAIHGHLVGSGASYVYTDVSNFFFSRAQREFSSETTVFRVYDVEKDPGDFGFASGSFDLVVASNVLHATRNVEKAVEHAVKLLKPGGILLLNEITRNDVWLSITIGVIEGWQRHDDEWRTDGPLLTSEAWEKLLRRCGMEKVAAIPGVVANTPALGQHIILAVKPKQLSIGSVDADATVNGDMHGYSAGVDEVAEDLVAALEGLADEERREYVMDYLKRIVAKALFVDDADLIEINEGFFDLGLDSLKAVDLAGLFSRSLSIEVPSSIFFDCPTIETLADGLLDLLYEPAPERSGKDVAKRAEQSRSPSGSDLITQLRQHLNDHRPG